jgi:O-antigen/teichoic acid export membrane protein
LGIVFKQSFKNSLVIYLGFLIGGLNTVIFYPQFMESSYYGVVVSLLAASNLFMPLIGVGVHFAIIKFFSAYNEKQQRDRFLSTVLFLPLFVAIPIGFIWDNFHDWILSYVPEENSKLIENFTLTIYIVAIACAYFEVFYAWAKVQLKSVLGNVLKEFWNRAAVMLLLLAVAFDFLTKPQFIYVLTGMYILRTLVMMIYAFSLYLPKFSLKPPENFGEVIRYGLYILLAGSAGAILLDIDKIMIPGKETFEKAAYYTVAVYIGTFIEVPSRAMRQILEPLTSQNLNDNDEKEVSSLYKRSSINLLVIGGLFFLLVNCSIHEFFKMMEEGFAGGELIVLMISFAKLYNVFLGNNRDIINNSKFYRIALPFAVGSGFSVYFLNKYFYFDLDYGTDGLAFATLITIFVFNSMKLWFVYYKFKMSPFTNRTFVMLLLIAVFFGVFYYWNFSFHPIVNIILKSTIIGVVYMISILKLKISPDLNLIASKLLQRFCK